MKILLDTHVLLWALTDHPNLSDDARSIIEDQNNQIYYSVISPWEVEIKHENHPDLMKMNGEELSALAELSGFIQVGVGTAEIIHLNNLQRVPRTPDHKDPFDRMMICQAAVNEMVFLTADERIAEYTDPCIRPV